MQSVLDRLEWRLLGPYRGGRVVAVAGHPSTPSTFYFGACGGGVWKTDDAGTTWRNVSDGFFQTAAVGAIAVAPADPMVVYAGMGEATIRNDVSHGDGVYRSDDGGETWRHLGLAATRHIGRIAIDPRDPDVAYVAAFGHAFEPNPERGLYRTRDGGRTWQLVLHRSERAGSHDVCLDPVRPHILLAAIWQAQRYPHALVSGGPDSGLWRSTDAGDTWQELSRRPGLPTGTLGKIGVALSPARQGRIWALVEADDGALFRSDDGGETWLRLSTQPLLRTRPWYYMHVTADPLDADTVYVQNYGLWKSTDGGRSFEAMPTPHGDEHALWLDPNDPRRMAKGDDGGCAISVNGGRTWTGQNNQPTAQLYHVTTDDRFPYRLYGSQQDNSSISLPVRSVEGAVGERDAYAPGGGESGYIAVKPDDPDTVVASGPAGRRAFNDVMTVYDHRTGQRRNITVWPELYGWGVGAESLRYRFGWTFPIVFSRHDPEALYVAGNRLFRSRDLGQSFACLSDDLTRNDPSRLGPSGGPVTRDNTGAEVYCTIFALAESPSRAGRWWAGTDDGLVHVSDDGGETWTEVTPPLDLLPAWALISVLEPSPDDPDTLYLAATRYKLGDNAPYLLVTRDLGRTWQDITDGLRRDDFTRVIRVDPTCPDLLFCGTETGVHARLGGRWQRLGGNLPVVPVHDLAIRRDDLLVATHGRSFWALEDIGPLRELCRRPLVSGGGPRLFAPAPVVRLRTYGGLEETPAPGAVEYVTVGPSKGRVLGVRRADGSVTAVGLDVALNRPEGVVVQYALECAPERPPTIAFLDAAGSELRRYERDVPGQAGLNRFAWNLRLAGVEPVKAPDLEPWPRPDGPLVLPGDYTVRLHVDGTVATAPFRVEPDPRIGQPMAALRAQYAFLLEIRDQLALLNRTLNAIDDRRGRLWALAGEGAGGVVARISAAQAELDALRGDLIDVHMGGAQLWPSGLSEKLNALFASADSADAPPTRQEREVLDHLSAQLAERANRFAALLQTPAMRALDEATARARALLGREDV